MNIARIIATCARTALLPAFLIGGSLEQPSMNPPGNPQ